VITAEKLLDGNRFEVQCKTKDGKESIAYFALHENGLWRISLGRATIKIGGWSFKTEELKAGFAQQEHVKGRNEQGFRNSATAIVGWVKNMVDQDKLISPLSLATLA